LKKETLIKRFP